MFLRNGSPAPSISIAQANAFELRTRASFSFIVSIFHGFTVGIPAPEEFFIAEHACSITIGYVPSPVNAAIPASAHADTRILLYESSS